MAGVFGSILGGLGGLGTSLFVKGGEAEYERALRVIEAVKDPEFDYSQIAPQDLALVAKYSPETYQAVVPDEVKTAQDSPEMRAALSQGMQQYKQIAQEGLPEADRLAAMGAGDSMRQAHRQALESSLRDLRERGRAGGGAEIAMRAAAGQQAANLARDQGRDLAGMAIGNRMAGLEGYTNLAGQTRGQDIGLSQSVADDYNTFARYVSSLQTNAARDAALSRQAAGNANVQAAQNTANYNTMNRQQTAEGNLNRKNNLINTLANFRMGKAQAAAGQRNRVGMSKDAEKAALVDNTMAIGQGLGSVADWQLNSFYPQAKG